MYNLSKFASVLAFCGESGSGKSTIAKLVKECLERKGLKAEFATKYICGRSKRSQEDPNVKIVNRIPKNCIKGYPREGEEIGYDLLEIKDMLKRGIFPIIITKDIKFLARLSSILNPETPNSFEEYDGKQLPVIRMRIYDVRSVVMQDEDIKTLTKNRHPNITEKEVDAELSTRKTSWHEYYKLRFASDTFLEQIVNTKNSTVTKTEIDNLVIGSLESDEDTLLGYIAMWHEWKKCNNAGVILGKYFKIAHGTVDYLKQQDLLDGVDGADSTNLA